MLRYLGTHEPSWLRRTSVPLFVWAAAGCRRALRAEADCKRLQDELATERVVLRRTADALEEFADSTHRQELTAALAAALRKRLAEQRPC